MKAQLFILSFLALLYFISAGKDGQRDSGNQNQEMDKPSSPSENGASSTGASTPASPRQRRSPPQFDSKNMKGKYAKANKQKRSANPFEYDNENEAKNLVQYLQPSAALASAGGPPAGPPAGAPGMPKNLPMPPKSSLIH